MQGIQEESKWEEEVTTIQIELTEFAQVFLLISTLTLAMVVISFGLGWFTGWIMSLFTKHLSETKC